MPGSDPPLTIVSCRSFISSSSKIQDTHGLCALIKNSNPLTLTADSTAEYLVTVLKVTSQAPSSAEGALNLLLPLVAIPHASSSSLPPCGERRPQLLPSQKRCQPETQSNNWPFSILARSGLIPCLPPQKLMNDTQPYWLWFVVLFGWLVGFFVPGIEPKGT